MRLCLSMKCLNSRILKNCRMQNENIYLIKGETELNNKSSEYIEIKKYKHWTLYLHECQCYLGRVYLLNDKTKAADFIELELDEREEFFQLGVKIKKVLYDL